VVLPARSSERSVCALATQVGQAEHGTQKRCAAARRWVLAAHPARATARSVSVAAIFR